MARPRIRHISAQEIYHTMTMTQIRIQYIKQSYVARRRYRQLAMKYPNSEVVLRHRGDFMPLRKMKGISKADLAKELSAVTRFLAGSSSRANEYDTVRGNTIKSFHEHGYKEINEENLDALMQFLEDARQRHLATIYGSEQLVEAFIRANKRKLSREQLLGNIEWWAEHADGKTQPRVYASRHSSVKDFYNKR